MSPNDYELGYDEGYQDAADMIHLKKQLAEIDKLARQWKARAEKAEAELRGLIDAAVFVSRTRANNQTEGD